MKKNLLKHIVCLYVLFLIIYPANAQWIQTKGPGGGDILALAVCKGNVFAGTLFGGIFRSSDSGKTWAPLNSGLSDINIYSFAVSDSTVFTGTDYEGLYFLNNNDTSWTRIIPGNFPDSQKS
jgi:hypothetical protein